ncbi:HAMP domain-containing histidine kinase [Streptomyces piniterrae]|uniref:histidine kinase n=1 Tax=Streptomyces piniterrae TaxID=2571125 RepID=A0A4U0NJJ9_9ACTN|nr:HAMP domain-containing sensor histidine kinase [Streptomyces piniterrae]TJZ50094.1 HAMP domain-containing histidine kinase [Streptomyces piniterrae]
MSSIPAAAGRRWLPGSERVRLTALYGGLLVLAGAMLIGLVNFLVQQGLYSTLSTAVTTAAPVRSGAFPPSGATTGIPVPARTMAPASPAPGARLPFGDGSVYRITKNITDATEAAALGRLLTVSLVALLVFAVISVALAWWMAGRVLRPVSVITSTARRLSAANLHERIALDAPPGELKQLADTFDGMLDRIEHLVSAQQRFAANAAHELRTPLAVQRAAAEIGLADPDPGNVRRIRGKLIEVADDSERLIEGLLLLSVSDQGLQHREPVALGELAQSVAAEYADDAWRRGLTIAADTLPRTPKDQAAPPSPTAGTAAEPPTVDADPVLLAHLVRNLVANAVRHNRPDGRITLSVHDRTLEVSNTGPTIPQKSIPYLFEPFRRLEERRHGPGEGAGLGLSIVASIARAHDASATAHPNPGGGLTVRVVFPERLPG